MTPYAVEVRYDVEFEPAPPEAEEALKIATEVYCLSQRNVYNYNSDRGEKPLW